MVMLTHGCSFGGLSAYFNIRNKKTRKHVKAIMYHYLWVEGTEVSVYGTDYTHKYVWSV